MKGKAEARRRRLERLCHSLDLDAFEGGLVLDLLERVEALQCELKRLRALLRASSPADLD